MKNNDLKTLLLPGEGAELARRVRSELRSKHGCHTILLYGSYARGDFTPESDIDILCVTEGGESSSDSRLWQGKYLDAWIYPQDQCVPTDFLHLNDAHILLDENSWGSEFLVQVKEAFAKGPEPLPEAERQTRLVWFEKMLDRIARDDLEARYRKHWLLVDLLRNYFELRTLWYMGPKRSFQWLKEHDPEIYEAFQNLYSPDCSLEAIKELTPKILVRSHS